MGPGSVPDQEEEEEEEVGHHVSLIPSGLHLPVIHPGVEWPDQPTIQLILSIKMQQWELQPEVASKIFWITDLTIITETQESTNAAQQIIFLYNLAKYFIIFFIFFFYFLNHPPLQQQ